MKSLRRSTTYKMEEERQAKPTRVPSSSSIMASVPTRVDATQALLIGTLAPGVNASTWAAWKIVMLALALSLCALLCVALGSSNLALLGHVILLISLAGILFALLSWFISETGFVTVEDQMKDLNLSDKAAEEKKSF